jgi:hypothetical protein
VGGLLLGKSGGGSGSRSGSGSLAALQRKLPLIEQRVQAIRGRGFRHPIAPAIVTGKQAQQAGLADLDRVEPRAAQDADQELLRLLGLIPAFANLRQIQGSILQDQVAGYYDSSDKRLALVRDATGSSEAIAEITLAHELTHALDDQVFGIKDQGTVTSDRALAYTALLEGDATYVMSLYAQRYISGTGLLGAALSAGSGGSLGNLPPYIQSLLEFPYLSGESFVGALYDVARGWKLVDFAFDRRPPISTEQVMHPLKYEANERPLRVTLNVEPALPSGRRSLSGSLGEFVTEQLLEEHQVPRDEAERAAAGWGGDRYELWQDGPDYAVVIRWRWDTPRDAAEFETALRKIKFRDSSAIRTFDGVVTLAIAPYEALAQRIVRAR